MRWTAEQIAEVRALAAAGKNKKELAALFRTTVDSITNLASRNGFKVEFYSAAEKQVFIDRAKLRDLAKDDRRNARKRAKRAKAARASGSTFVARPTGGIGAKVPLHRLRQMYAANKDLTKNQLRAQLTQAVINTAAMQERV